MEGGTFPQSYGDHGAGAPDDYVRRGDVAELVKKEFERLKLDVEAISGALEARAQAAEQEVAEITTELIAARAVVQRAVRLINVGRISTARGMLVQIVKDLGGDDVEQTQ